jgi:hypothetical protein
VKTKLILDSVDAWLLTQKTLVNRRSRSVIPAIRDRNSLVTTLKGLLESLGLERRSKPVKSLEEYFAQKKAEAKAEEEPAEASTAVSSAGNGTPGDIA